LFERGFEVVEEEQGSPGSAVGKLSRKRYILQEEGLPAHLLTVVGKLAVTTI